MKETVRTLVAAAAVIQFACSSGAPSDGDIESGEVWSVATERQAITAVAQGFMTAFPDMVLKMDSLHTIGGTIEYHWTFTGTNTGPGGTGNAVRFSGHEEWTLGENGLIVSSLGHFDEAEYQRQLESGVVER